VLAAVVPALVYAGTARPLRVIAAMSGGFAAQCIAVTNRPAQRRIFAGAGAVMILLATLATVVSGPNRTTAREVLLALVAFGVFPTRALLPGRPFFPIFAFTTVLFVTAFGSDLRPIESALATLCGVVVAFLVLFGPSRSCAPVDIPLAPRAAAAPPLTCGKADLELALCGAAASLVAGELGRALHVIRPYWVQLSAVVLLASSWRESAQKAIQRVTMTAIGCGVGWLLYLAVADRTELAPPILFACVFFAIYFRPVSYATMMLFISLYVVLLFSSVARWTLSIAIARVEDTALGAAIAVALTSFPRLVYLARQRASRRATAGPGVAKRS
jgi:hypothetical protein